MAMRKLRPEPPGTQQRVFGYCRVSSEAQADSGISLDEQRTKLSARCTEMGWQLENIFVDAAVSGATPLAKRPQGQLLLNALRPGDTVIASKMDRMFRSSVDALTTIERFKAQRISLWLLDLGNDCTGNGIGQLVATILGAVAEFERSLISERTRDAKRQQRRSGRHLGGDKPFGYRLVEAIGGGAPLLVPDEAEQAAIADIHKMRAAGRTLFAIRDAMRERGHQISHETVRRVLNRSAGIAA